ncbi:hypothetical protein P7M46_10635 [Bisgaard Taxon 10/6]|uniref:hypothetical protein n=1 Tax=Exercitatus varius TaxID=67857 RepID=UPI00294B5AA9|nr:hypothetical protein [Exercitatus varius]MDG2918454.1 hypothetical protein [Exercitatus varius]MDG2941307.1 hypothetical protein [Exercitatus varius]
MKKNLLALSLGLMVSTAAVADTIFLAGATGVVGEPLSKALVEAGHTVNTNWQNVQSKGLR